MKTPECVCMWDFGSSNPWSEALTRRHRAQWMSSILAYTQNGTFSPIDIGTMSAVLDDVCEPLKINGDAIAREFAAVRIVELAQRGCACLGRGQEELVRWVDNTP